MTNRNIQSLVLTTLTQNIYSICNSRAHNVIKDSIVSYNQLKLGIERCILIAKEFIF